MKVFPPSTKAKRKPIKGWIICSGEIPLLWTARHTKKQCLADYFAMDTGKNFLEAWDSVRRIRIEVCE